MSRKALLPLLSVALFAGAYSAGWSAEVQLREVREAARAHEHVRPLSADLANAPLEADADAGQTAFDVADSIAFTPTFLEAAVGAKQWNDQRWKTIGEKATSLIKTGNPSAYAFPATRGKAKNVGIWKFKDRTDRVFFRLDFDGRRPAITFLDVQSKKQLMRGGEDDYYDDLADRALEERTVGEGTHSKLLKKLNIATN